LYNRCWIVVILCVEKGFIIFLEKLNFVQNYQRFLLKTTTDTTLCRHKLLNFLMAVGTCLKDTSIEAVHRITGRYLKRHYISDRINHPHFDRRLKAFVIEIKHE